MVDAHVHLFPPRLFEAIWAWFEQHGWPVRYRLHAGQVIEFLVKRGVSRIVALHYAHKPGMARAMNAWMADLCQVQPSVTGMATVFPGETGAVAIVEDAFRAGLRGVKLHCHVQCLPIDDRDVMEILAVCARWGLPAVVHAGREPKSPAYRCDPHLICHVDRTAAVLAALPTLNLCVPHLGADEFVAYGQLLERHENLWLDTTMALADYLPVSDNEAPWRVLDSRPDRLVYGTDFPNLPYAWDRELVRILERRLGDERLAALLGGNADVLHPAPVVAL